MVNKYFATILTLVLAYLLAKVGCGLVNDRKEGKWHHYSLNCETLMNYKHFIESLTCLGCGDGDCCK